METQQMIDLCKRHTLFNWSARGAVAPLPIARAEGVYLYTPDGDRILDFNSQLMSVNIGHSHPRVVAAMKEACDGLIYSFPGSATEPRARLSSKLASMLPGDLDTVFFTLGGAESNENAIKLARLYTGRHKILSRYRSYHGATNLCMQMTGDPRRWANEPGSPGFVRVMDPEPYSFSFGSSPEQRTENNLRYLREVIEYEGPQTIAAMVIETVTGTNGVLPPPPGYLQGLRALLDEHGILLICDEVMSGWGRTGKLFAFEHGDIIPDIVTMAKGLTSSYVPLGCVAMRNGIARHFDDNVFWGGLTYNSHPLALNIALAVIQVFEEEGLVERSAQMGEVMRGHMQTLKDKHPCVRDFRQIGLFGMVDVQDTRGELIAGYNGKHPAMAALGAHFRREGLFTFVRWSHFMCNPPLIITEEQLAEGFDIIDRGLDIVELALAQG
ncbi:MAG TPA: aminotransferase class III-fold pyridoxal phosphate-dependent enzyme [Myxococcota bacterium]|nr:aminotransferase class III-fold pyridoxal phosphate-dependent enzyme [Myxococcota bacterium]